MYVKDVGSGLGKIKWYYKKATETSYNPYEEETTYTGQKDMQHAELKITGLSAETEYDMYAEVYDILGNKTTSGTRTIETLSIPELTIGTNGNVTFDYSTDKWTNGNVTVTASATVTGYTLQTRTENTDWSSATSQTFTANGRMYARLTDGINYGKMIFEPINNIDTTKPTIIDAFGSNTNIRCSHIGTDNVTVEMYAQDEESGLGKIVWYYKTSETSYKPYEEELIYTGQTTEEHASITISGLSPGTTYSIYAAVYDVAGNRNPSTNSIEVETFIELKDANSTIKSTNNFYGNVTANVPTYSYFNVKETNLSSGMIVYVPKDVSLVAGNITYYTTKAGYYHLIAPFDSGHGLNEWLTVYLGTSCLVSSDIKPVELKDIGEADDTIKSLYNYYGEVEQGQPGYGSDYINLTDYSDLKAGMIIHTEYDGVYSTTGAYIPAGYYKLISESSHKGFWSYKSLGTSFKAYCGICN